MNWCFVRIFIVSYAIVLCGGEDYPDQPQSKQDEPNSEHEKTDIGHHHYGHYSYPGYHHGPYNVVTTTPTRQPPSTDPDPFPHPSSKWCPRYEEYHDCRSPRQVECSNLGEVCSIKNIPCSNGCYCIPGYARLRTNGPCVPQFKCPKPYCLESEVWLDCYQASACDRQCTDLGKTCDTLEDTCNAGCFCRPGYMRQGYDCIPCMCSHLEKCPKYERYFECGNSCMESCFKNSAKCKTCERSGCFCVEGYSRINGFCRPDSQCPERQCSDQELFLECGYACQDDCDVNKTCVDECVQGCFCKDEYARINGVCVPRPKCEECPPKEKYHKCGDACIESCYKDSQCVPCALSGCFCVKGYSRIDGVCQPDKQCPNRQCPAHELFLECGYACQDDCDENKPCIDECVQGCFCKDKYARINGVCVPRPKCEECPPNEKYRKCGDACIESCYKDSQCVHCALSGCFCVNGYSRIDGVCQPDKQCPNRQCSAHELFLECGYACQDDCESIETCTEQCISGCFCEPNYVRVNGKCVHKNECPSQCTNLKEVYSSCGNNCTDLCLDPSGVCTLDCYSGCFCDEGFSRLDYNSPCVLESNCPNPCPDPNESYKKRGDRCQEKCNSESCSDRWEAGCFCVPEHSRNNEGECIPTVNCPPKCNDAHEEYTVCGNACREQCGNENILCPLICRAGCFCKNEYSRNNTKCIKTSECPVKCKKANEIYKCGDKCREKCNRRYCNEFCKSDCFCQDEYLRIKGDCVRGKTCPTCGKNQVYTYQRTECKDLCNGEQRNCSKMFTEGCSCKDNYKRIERDDLECVRASECPQI